MNHVLYRLMQTFKMTYQSVHGPSEGISQFFMHVRYHSSCCTADCLDNAQSMAIQILDFRYEYFEF